MATIYKATKITMDADGNEIATTVEFTTEGARDSWASENDAASTAEESRDLTPPAEPIPDVTPRQMRQALVLSGVSFQSIEDALNSLSEPTKTLARIEWEYSIAFQRSRPLVSSMAAMLGLSSAQVDNLWRLAATL